MPGDKTPKFSIIVASKDGRQTIEECLLSIEKQKDSSVEIIVVDQSNDGTSQFIENRFPDVRLIKYSRPALIPELWSVGIAASSGQIIAITIAQFAPAVNWITSIIESLKPPYSAVGGAIENSDTASLCDWALYFCRYSNYMLPFVKREVDDMAGDNAAYKRDALGPYKDIFKKGFWENMVNAAMVKDGLKILLTPDIVAVHKKSFGVIPFSIQRFLHGYHYGKDRLPNLLIIKRSVYILISPLIPVVHFKRILQRVLQRNRHKVKLALSLPILFLFIMCWSIGELCGYISGVFRKHELS
jgi:glycosyltransferase involved in cell wall biosynthesis